MAKTAPNTSPDGGGLPVWLSTLLMIILILPLAYFVFPANTEFDGHQVVLDQGAYVGTILKNNDHPVPIEAWLGIPYARPPVGKLRFTKPQPITAGKRHASAEEYGHR